MNLSINHPRSALRPDPRHVTYAPPVDVHENDDELLVVVDLPGVSKDGLQIQLDKGLLSVEARRSATTDVKGRPDYRRVFQMPEGIDEGRIAAELANGVLRLHLPKSAASKPREIAVHVG